MNKKSILGVAIVLTGAAFFLLKNSSHSDQLSLRHNGEEVHSPADISRKENKTKPNKSISFKNSKKEEHKENRESHSKIEKKTFTPQNTAEKSLHSLNQKWAQVYKKRDDPKELINFFEENKLAPELVEDSNEYTGTMLIIRTRKALPGTRYYHAQYMGDDAEHALLQHLSYQFKPGNNSMKRAVESAEATYDLSNKKVFRDGDFITYDLGEEGTHELSIEKATYASLKDDPYNAHTKEDEGTIITRIELKIHGDNDEGHIHK